VIISLVVAMDEMRGIGLNGALPWHLPADLKFFKSLTMGHHIIMGRKTYESIRRPLPGRIMVVVTRNPAYQAEGCIVVHSLESALEVARDGGEEEAFIIGGGEIFTAVINLADRIYLTLVHTVTEADVFFPIMNPGDWVAIDIEDHQPDDKHEFPYTFKTLIRQNEIKIFKNPGKK
jgi:dihydrofolate reductase